MKKLKLSLVVEMSEEMVLREFPSIEEAKEDFVNQFQELKSCVPKGASFEAKGEIINEQ